MSDLIDLCKLLLFTAVVMVAGCFVLGLAIGAFVRAATWAGGF